MEYASALRVDLTTRPICFECQTTGENSVVSFRASPWAQAIVKNPWWSDSCLADAKLASPKLTKHTSCIGNGRTMTNVSAKAGASRKTRLPSSKVSTGRCNTLLQTCYFCVLHASFPMSLICLPTPPVWRLSGQLDDCRWSVDEELLDCSSLHFPGLWREAVFKVFCPICFLAASKITYKQFLTQKKQVSYPKCI